MEAKTAQVRIKPRCIIAEGASGTIVWLTPSRARLLIDGGAVELVNTVGPTETKPVGATEKKSLPAAPAGPSTDSASSNPPGVVGSLFASVVDLVSPAGRSKRQQKRDAASLPSTTPTE
jgi:hypothetical protein